MTTVAMDYKVVTHKDESLDKAKNWLEYNVRAEMKTGWMPTGGVAQVFPPKSENCVVLMQAMIKAIEPNITKPRK